MIEPRDERWSAWIDGELHPDELARLEAEFLADPRRRVEAEEFRERVLQTREALRDAADRPSDGASRRALEAVIGGAGGRRSARLHSLDGPMDGPMDRPVGRRAVGAAAPAPGADSTRGPGSKKAVWLPFVGSLAAAVVLGCAIFWAIQTPPAVGLRDEVASSSAPAPNAAPVGAESEHQPTGETASSERSGSRGRGRPEELLEKPDGESQDLASGAEFAQRNRRPRGGESDESRESAEFIAARLRDSLRSVFPAEDPLRGELADSRPESPREVPQREANRIAPSGAVADPGEPAGSIDRESDRELARFELGAIRATGGGNEGSSASAEELDSVLVPDVLLVLADVDSDLRAAPVSDLPEGASAEGAEAVESQPTTATSPSAPSTESAGDSGATGEWAEEIRQRVAETATAGLTGLDAPPTLDLRAQRENFEAVERTLLGLLESAGRTSQSLTGTPPRSDGDSPEAVAPDPIVELWQPAIDGLVTGDSLTASLRQTRWFVGRRLSLEDPSVPMFGYESPGFRALIAGGPPTPDGAGSPGRTPAPESAQGQVGEDPAAGTNPPVQDLALLIEGTETEVVDLVVALDRRLRTVDPGLRSDLGPAGRGANDERFGAQVFFSATTPLLEPVLEAQTVAETRQPAGRLREALVAQPPVVRLIVRLRPEPPTEKR